MPGEISLVFVRHTSRAEPKIRGRLTTLNRWWAFLLLLVCCREAATAYKVPGRGMTHAGKEEGPSHSAVGPEALHMHSYFPVPRQRLVHALRQAGNVRFLLSATSARCSSLTGPACLYGPVPADPAAESEEVAVKWKSADRNVKLKLVLVKSGDGKPVQKSLLDSLRKAARGKDTGDGGGPAGSDLASVASQQGAQVLFDGDPDDFRDFDRIVEVMATAMGMKDEATKAHLGKAMAQLMAEAELRGAKLGAEEEGLPSPDDAPEEEGRDEDLGSAAEGEHASGSNHAGALQQADHDVDAQPDAASVPGREQAHAASSQDLIGAGNGGAVRAPPMRPLTAMGLGPGWADLFTFTGAAAAAVGGSSGQRGDAAAGGGESVADGGVGQSQSCEEDGTCPVDGNEGGQSQGAQGGAVRERAGGTVEVEFDFEEDDEYDMDAELDAQQLPQEWLEEYEDYVMNMTAAGYLDGYDEDY